MPTRSSLRQPRLVKHSLEFGEDTVTFTVDVNRITDEWMADWNRYEEESDTPQLNAALADLIHEWDILEEENGPTIPVSAEEVGKLFSLPSKVQMMRAFATLPTDAEGNASGNTSSTPSSDSTSTPAIPPNGQATSPSVKPSAFQSTK